MEKDYKICSYKYNVNKINILRNLRKNQHWINLGEYGLISF